jgi:K+-transporting ATPase ATPase C chain
MRTQTLFAPIRMLLVLTLLTGVLYPLVVTGAAQLFFRNRANGSLIVSGGWVVGSELIGRPFAGPRDFHPRPSATAPGPYNAGASSGSNYGPLHPALAESLAARVARVGAETAGPVPVDLVTASASGLDPHLSPAAAFHQVPRVAAARGLSEAAVRRAVEESIEPRLLGLFGEPRVNVLLLNRRLDAMGL